MSLRIGTSGWSYPSGKGTWNGLFYPATRSVRDGTKGFDELRFYSEHFDTVEVNSTFYGQARAEVARSCGHPLTRSGSTSTLSTIPITAASTGAALRPSASPAARPSITISTFS